MGYEPNSKGEERFIKKHRVDTKDYPVPNEGQEPFKTRKDKDASKAANYMPGEDKKVYESYEELVELSKKTLASYVKKSNTDERANKGRDKLAFDHMLKAIASKDEYGMDMAGHTQRRTGRQIFKRQEGQKLARKKLGERGLGKNAKVLAKEETELNELSKNTLKNYISRAKNDAQVKMTRGHNFASKADKSSNNYEADQHYPVANHYFKKAMKRHDGISKARKKLGEENDLNELSNETLLRYAKKAHKRGDMAARMSYAGRDEGMAKIANKRYYGVQQAIAKVRNRLSD